MHLPVPSGSLGITIAVIWLCLAAVIAAGYWAIRWWRRTPRQMRRSTYSRRLEDRFNASRKTRCSRD